MIRYLVLQLVVEWPYDEKKFRREDAISDLLRTHFLRMSKRAKTSCIRIIVYVGTDAVEVSFKHTPKFYSTSRYSFRSIQNKFNIGCDIF